MLDASHLVQPSGGLVFFAGSLIKSLIKNFGRTIQTVCLSSAETESHATICEGCHESISIALMTETFLSGLPKKTCAIYFRMGRLISGISLIGDWSLEMV